MDVSQIVKSTQEQAVASWIDHLNQLRVDELVSNLSKQDTNLAAALEELQRLKDFVGNPEHILGSDLTKHGEIAEHAQVNISNARKLIEGLKGEYTFDGVGRTAPEDYLRNGTQIQSKFYAGSLGNKTFEAIKGHLDKYPDFIRNGGEYEIPKDQYEKITNLLKKPMSHLSRSEYNLVQQIKEWESANGVSFSDKIKPTAVDYPDVQQGKIGNTIDKEDSSIKDTDQKRRDEAYQHSRPSLKQGLKVTATSAAVEGGISFCLGVAKKLKSGKKLNEFTAQDWKDVSIDTAEGTAKGAIRGASVYGLTNFTATPAVVASSLVTAAFGVAAQAQLLHQGKISNEEFIVNSEVVCLDVTVSAIASIMGQVFIPIPALGAVVGNAVGMFMYGIVKNILSKQEQTLIASYNSSIQKLNEQLDAHYKELIEILKREFAKFKSIVEFAFDLNVNIAFASSVRLAQYVGCPDEKILKDKAAVDTFFLN
jgi:hypothetical protein